MQERGKEREGGRKREEGKKGGRRSITNTDLGFPFTTFITSLSRSLTSRSRTKITTVLDQVFLFGWRRRWVHSEYVKQTAREVEGWRTGRNRWWWWRWRTMFKADLVQRTQHFFLGRSGFTNMLREGRGEWLESTPKSASAIFEGEDHKCLNSPRPPQKTITLKNVADRSAQTTEQPSPYLFSDFPLRGVPATTVGQLTTIFSFLL